MNQHFDVLIIGAGLSGIGTACHVTAEFPDKTIALLERRERLGGTWDLFRYPGVRSDSDMFTFGYKFRPWRDVKVLADGASIRQYIADTATEFGVDEKIHYGLKVNTAEWSSRQCRWTVAGVHEATGETRTYTCDYLISCTGYYNYDAGYLPDFPGVHRFGGRCVHPQHWPEDLDYSGKKVVVIGSGATAVTLVPAMAGSNPGSAAHVTMLQRSPSYIFSLPAVDKISEVLGRFLPDRWVYEFGRRRNIAIQRKLYQACRRWPKLMRRLLLWEVRRRLGRSVDMSNFTPNYLPWDERLCAVPNGDLFKTLASGAASVVTDQIETFTEKGILCKSGREIEADIIVTATGLNIQMLGGMRLIVDGAEYQLPEKMTYKGVLLENAPQSGLDHRLHQRVMDPEVRHRRRLPVPAAAAHGRQRLHGGNAARCAGLRAGRWHVRPAELRLCEARPGHHAAPGLQASVEGAHALREGRQDPARRPHR